MRKINKLFLLGLLFCSVNMNAQWDWVTKSKSATEEKGLDVSTDAVGNSYMTGSFTNSVLFGGIALTSSGQTDAYLTKINTVGTIQWAVKAGGTSFDAGSRVITNGSDIYVAGVFRSNITFFSTNATTTSLTGNNFDDECFIAKYNSNGVVQWATTISGPNAQTPWDIELNNSLSRLYITGENDNKNFINCYNFLTGTLLWSKINTGTTSDATGFGIAVDANGDCYSIAKFNKGTYEMAGSSIYSISMNTNLVMMKLDASGNFVWGQSMGITATNEQPRDIDIDVAGNLYVSGQYTDGALSIPPFTLGNSGFIDLFVAKFPNTGGNATWVKKIGGTQSEYPTGQCIDPVTGNLYLAVKNGEGNSVTLPGTCYTFSAPVNAPGEKAYVAKFKTNGDIDWAISPILDISASQFNGLSIDANKNVYVSGNLIAFGTFNNIILSAAGSDAILAKINLEPSFKSYRICEGQSATITNTAGNGLIFKWYTSNTSSTPIHVGSTYTTPALNNTTTYYVSTVIGNCESARIPVLVSILPAAIVTAGLNQIICAGSCTDIHFTSSTGSVILTNLTTGVNLGTYSSSPITVCPSTTALYSLTNTSSPNYCNSSDEIEITVTQPQTVSSDFALTGHVPSGNTLLYIVTANVTSIPSGSGFFWEVSEVDDFGNIIPNTTIVNPSNWWNTSLQLTNTFPGYDVPISNFVNTTVGNGKFYLNHRYRITRGTWLSGNNCSWTSTSKEIFLCTNCKTIKGQAQFIVENSNYAPSMEEMMNKSKVKAIDIPRTTNVFPNPNNGTFTITSAQLETTLKINVKDLFGKLIYTETKVIKDGKVQLQLNCNKGSYLVEMEDLNTKESKTQKVIIQ